MEVGGRGGWRRNGRSGTAEIGCVSNFAFRVCETTSRLSGDRRDIWKHAGPPIGVPSHIPPHVNPDSNLLSGFGFVAATCDAGDDG